MVSDGNRDEIFSGLFGCLVCVVSLWFVCCCLLVVGCGWWRWLLVAVVVVVAVVCDACIHSVYVHIL